MARSIKSRPLLVILSALAVIGATSTPSDGYEVDTSSPDLSMFKLKHVGDQQVSRKRADDPVEDLATGSQLMRESLYLNDFQVKCISYGHLLKLIHLQSLRTGEPRPIKLDTIEALTIVADLDRAVYFELFRLHQSRGGLMPNLFVSAIEQLDSADTLTARDAWFDLIECAQAYFPEQTREFLSEPSRAKSLENFQAFRVLPVDQDEWVAQGKLVPKVERLVRKYDGFESNMKPLDDEDLLVARMKIEAFDDQELASLRDKIKEAIRNGVQLNLSEVEEQEEPTPVDEPEEKSSEQTTPQVSERVDKKKADRVAARLAIMTFARRRVERLDSHKPHFYKLSFNTASDFVTHWSDLKQLAGSDDLKDVGAELGARVTSFLADPVNQRIAERMSKSVENLKAIGQQLERMHTTHKSFSSMEELEREYAHLIGLLDRVDKALDIYDLLRAFSVQKSKDLHEFRVINRFVEDDISWG